MIPWVQVQRVMQDFVHQQYEDTSSGPPQPLDVLSVVTFLVVWE